MFKSYRNPFRFSGRRRRAALSKRYTIYDLAGMLGLSVATTSKALNGYADVSEKTRARVLAKAREIGFEPSIAARTITTKKSFLIGVIYHYISDGLMHPHFIEILEFFRQTMEDAGYQIMFVGKNGSGGRSLLQSCLYRSVDGIMLLSYDGTAPELAEVMQSPLPTVSVAYEWPDCASVLSDNRAGMRLLVDYLYGLGHRSFAYFTFPTVWPVGAGAERYAGFMQALAQKRIDITEDHILRTRDLTYRDGQWAAEEMLRRGIRPTAVLTAHDRIALGAIDTLHKRGIRVPEDLSVTGFDDLQTDYLVSQMLTTVRQQRRQIGVTSANLMLEQISGGTKRDARIRLPVELVERSSVQAV